MTSDSYIQTLKQSPAASQVISNVNDADTLLNLNTPVVKQKIDDGLNASLTQQQLPEPARRQIKENLESKQQGYSEKVVNAFTDSLHKIFAITVSIMVLAGVLGLFLKERPLRAAAASETPGA